MKLVLIFVLLLASSRAQNCASPVECYTQAINILKEDRDELRRTNESLKLLVATNQEKYLNALNDLKSQHELTVSQLNQQIAQLQSQTTELKTSLIELNKPITQLQYETKELKVGLGNSNTYLYSMKRNAGFFQQNDCNANNYANPFTQSLSCMAGYTRQLVGRIKDPDNACGATLFICVPG